MKQRLHHPLVLAVAILLFIAAGCVSRKGQFTPFVWTDELNEKRLPDSVARVVSQERVELGRYLFYDPILSRNRDLSCGGCHQQENAFSDYPARFSTGFMGQRQSRNTPAIFNLAWSTSFFWDGRSPTLEHQALGPVKNPTEMNLDWPEAQRRVRESKFYREWFRKAYGDRDIDSLLIADAIAQFERTLISFNSKFDRVKRGEAQFTSEEAAGFELASNMQKAGCLSCHPVENNVLLTAFEFANPGLEDAKTQDDFADKGRGAITKNPDDNGAFKVPSLRNLVFTAPYMHDGRFYSLEEVVDFYSEGIKANMNVDGRIPHAKTGGSRLTPQEKKQLIAFLHTLSDSSFVTNPAYSDPRRAN